MKKYKETLTSDRIRGGIQYSRELWIDELKVFAILAVIMIHVSTQYWTTIDVNNRKWVIITFYNCMSRWAVPVLVMVTGTLLGNPKKKLTPRKLKEKLLHIISFFVFWSVVYTILGIVPDVIRGTGVQIDEIVSRTIKGHFHLWYCYMLMGLYFISPFLQKIIEDEKLLKYFVFLSIVVTFGISQIVELKNLSLLHTVFSLTGTPVIMVPLLTCIIAVFSYVSVWVIRKIPYLRCYIV